MRMPLLSENLSDENKMTIKFVNVKATTGDVYNAFKGCGAITKVVFPSVKSTKYKVAHIYFELEGLKTDNMSQFNFLMESAEGRHEALKSFDVDIMNVEYVVVVEATSPSKGRERMCIPDLIGYPELAIDFIMTSMIGDIRGLKVRALCHTLPSSTVSAHLPFGRHIRGLKVRALCCPPSELESTGTSVAPWFFQSFVIPS